MGVADISLRVCQVYREVCHVPVCVCQVSREGMSGVYLRLSDIYKGVSSM